MNIEKEILSLGIIGHVDHGKTSFTSAATKALEKYGEAYGATAKAYDQIDKAPEEKARGITIKQTTLEVYSSKRHYVIIDCPGHADYIKNMIAGAFQVDSVILLVAANASVQEQTREHLRLASNRVKSVNLFINKMDLLDNLSEEDREFTVATIEAEVEELCEDLKIKLVVKGRGCAQKALSSANLTEKQQELDNIKAFFASIDEQIDSPVRDIQKPFKMFIDNVYSIPGRGTVVSGLAEQGMLEVGQGVQIVRMGRSTKEKTKTTTVSDLEEFKRKINKISAGANFGCLLRGIDKTEVETGDMLMAIMPIQLFNNFKVRMLLLSSAEGGRNSEIHAHYQPSFYVGTSPHTGSIIEIRDKDDKKIESAQPGDMEISAIVSFTNPIYIEPNTTMIVREGGKTVGYATVISGISDNTVRN